MYMVACVMYFATWLDNRRRGVDSIYGRRESLTGQSALGAFVVRHVDFEFGSTALFAVGVLFDSLQTLHANVLDQVERANTLFLISNALWTIDALVEIVGYIIDKQRRDSLNAPVRTRFSLLVF